MAQQPMSRRTALRRAAGTALAAGAALAVGGTTTPAAAAGTLQDVRAFHGTWQGAYDGRQARLEIVAQQQPPSSYYTLFLTFTELERNETYSGYVQYVPRDAHEIRGITLTGPSTLSWPVLLLHTWNTDYLSGTSSWNGTGFPMSFYRSSVAPPFAAGRPFRGYGDWYSPPHDHATYAGTIDGRRATLEVLKYGVSGKPQTQFTLTDLDRGTAYAATFLDVDFGSWSADRQRNPLAGVTMSPIRPGPEPKYIESLYWHSWNAMYVSGADIWQGGRYGMSFIRQTPLP
ncbi:hypothetical protein [Streptomyces cinnamoneus]|uniref:Uncharacterized protein n=1 Tax=Streptomyces cinnamoneus TaxID=53446 RepID=A0A918WJ66_STRCJ|nr:hypothetical protein [Streptomyces cinnamoneus]GHC51379.1 hypothetical protein GCM10010507_29140 [Streptomyces cinnamoneus]